MATTLTSSGFDSGSSGVAITTANTTFDGVSTPGLTFDNTHFHSGSLSAKVAATAQTTRGMWWGSTAMGGTQTTLFGRFYLYFTAAPPNLARLINLQSGGTVLCGIALNTSRNITVRNVKASSTPSGGTSTAVLATNTWHRIEWSATVSGTSITVVVRIYAAGNADTTTITETVSPSAMTGLAASVDSVMHGLSFSAAQTYSVWLDDATIQVGSGATWLGPTLVTPPVVNTGDFVLQYDMNADTWNTTGNPWASLPSKLSVYPAAKSNWGFTAPENVTSGTYADGTKYFQMVMSKLKATDAHARFGAGDYGCRFKFDVTATSITTGRVQWDEEWTGGNLSKTSFMGWPDTGNWPAAGERDFNEQWNKPLGVQVTFHKFLATANGNNGQLVLHAKQVDTSSRMSFRVTVLATKVIWEYKPHGTSTWLKGFPDITADPSWWQPTKGYHIEGAVAYSQQVSKGASTNDQNRQASVRRISNIKVWSGTDPGNGGTDTTPPSPNPPTAPAAVLQGAGPSVLVNLTACTDASSGVDFYTLQRAYDTVASPGTPDLATVVTFDNVQTLQYLDTGTSVGDKVYYREKCTDQANNPTSYSSWSTMLTVTGPVDLPICVGAVAPADGSAEPGDSVTVSGADPSVTFSAPSTVGADSILVDPGDGTGTILTILPADNAVDPNTGSVLYTYPLGQNRYTATFTALNSAGSATDTVTVDVIEGAGTDSTPTPRDVWVIPGDAAYRAGAPVGNELYLALQLNVASDIPTLVDGPNGVHYCVDAGPAGPTPDSGDGGGNNPGDQEPFTDVFDDTF